MAKKLKKEKESEKASDFDFKSTKEVKVSDRIIDQVIGQDSAVELIRKASIQKRNVLLVGLPGTGKSLLAQAVAELLPIEKLFDVLIYPNKSDSNNPRVRRVPAGEGRKAVQRLRLDAKAKDDNMRLLGFLMPLGWFLLSGVLWQLNFVPDVVFAAMLILGGFLLVGFALGTQIKTRESIQTPKLLIDNANRKMAPFIDATGARAGSLLGDVRHDPLQSGGLGTPPHLRVEPGAIHRASGGVLFLDEISLLGQRSQQELLTAMQERKYAIMGQSEMSSGALTKTEAVPCDFVLVAAGNYEDLQKVHPALRSRIRGYGYEIYLNLDMPDTKENRFKVIQFIAQEIKKDGKIPHFSLEACNEIITEALRRSNRKHKLTLKLRDLGGLVRAAGDLAKAKGHSLVQLQDVVEAKMAAKTLEQQMVGKILEFTKDYEVYQNIGEAVGKVNGLAVMSDAFAGIVLPIEAEAAPAMSASEGKLIATGKLGEIAKEAVQNVSALIKKLSGKDISKFDLHIQFLQAYPGGVEGDSASISVATAVISALEKIPVRQDTAMTGSLSVRGEVLPVGGVTGKIQSAIQAGFKQVIIPKANLEDIVLDKKELNKIKIIPVQSISEVLANAFVKGTKTNSLLKQLNKLIGVKMPASLIAKPATS